MPVCNIGASVPCLSGVLEIPLSEHGIPLSEYDSQCIQLHVGAQAGQCATGLYDIPCCVVLATQAQISLYTRQGRSAHNYWNCRDPFARGLLQHTMCMSVKWSCQRCRQRRWRLAEDPIWHSFVYAYSRQTTGSSSMTQPTELRENLHCLFVRAMLTLQ